MGRWDWVSYDDVIAWVLMPMHDEMVTYDRIQMLVEVYRGNCPRIIDMFGYGH